MTKKKIATLSELKNSVFRVGYRYQGKRETRDYSYTKPQRTTPHLMSEMAFPAISVKHQKNGKRLSEVNGILISLPLPKKIFLKYSEEVDDYFNIFAHQNAEKYIKELKNNGTINQIENKIPALHPWNMKHRINEIIENYSIEKIAREILKNNKNGLAELIKGFKILKVRPGMY